MATDKNCKVLLFGHQFNCKTGLGITLSNLFARWPNESIAVFTNGINVEECSKARPCIRYIGSTDRKFLSSAVHNSKIRNVLKSIYVKSGVQDLRHNWSYKEEDVQIAKEFNPDILFCCLGSYGSMLDCEKMLNLLPHAKLVLYIVDDWVNTKSKNRYFRHLWDKRNDALFRRLLAKSVGLFSICTYMSESYLQKYGKIFYPFHNPVDVGYWDNLHPAKKYPEDITSIVYTGKINEDTKDCLLDMCKAIQKLNCQGGIFVFDVYTPDYGHNTKLFKEYDSCHVFPPIPHHEVPAVMKSYSALLLTLGFSQKSREYVRLSMPTKLSEYLASGVPIMLYCPQEIALAKYVGSKDCAICCFERNVNRLIELTQKLEDKAFCKDLSVKASQVARDHDVEKVRFEFENRLKSFV